MYVSSSHSVTHQRWVDVQKQQKQLYPNDAPDQLQRLSDTRWAWSCGGMPKYSWQAWRLNWLFYAASDCKCADRAIESEGLLALFDISFVLMMNLFCDLLGKAQLLSNQLQDLSEAAELVTVLRVNNQTRQVFDAAQEQRNERGIDLITPPARRRPTARLQIAEVIR